MSPQTHSDDNQALVLTAMAHPLRRRLLDVLKVNRAATVSALAAQTGQAAGNISHHLKVLARAGLVEEAPERARDNREHWWRNATETIRWSTLDAGDDPASEAVAIAAESINLEHQLALTRTWLTGRDAYEAEWQRAAFSTDGWLRLTPDELNELEGEVNDLVARWSRREPDDDATREPVFMFARAFPGHP
jgi:DNA-binding transcriptional ArsR family regulator